MDNMNQQNQPNGMAQKPPMQKPAEHSSVGGTIGIIIVIIVLILGGLYFWGAQLEKDGYDPAEDASVQGFENTNDSDDLAALEADLEEDFGSLEGDVSTFDSEVDSL